MPPSTGFTEKCTRCNHHMLEFDEHPECDCGCHKDMKTLVEKSGMTVKQFKESMRKEIDRFKAIDNVLGSGLFK